MLSRYRSRPPGRECMHHKGGGETKNAEDDVFIWSNAFSDLRYLANSLVKTEVGGLCRHGCRSC